MSSIPPWSTQLTQCSLSYKSTTTLLSVLSHTDSYIWVIKSYSHDSYIGWPLSWSLRCFSKSLRTGSNKQRAAEGLASLFYFGHIMSIHYPGRSSYLQMTWNRQSIDTGTSPGCWYTGLHHRCLGSPHTHQYLKIKGREAERQIKNDNIKQFYFRGIFLFPIQGRIQDTHLLYSWISN